MPDTFIVTLTDSKGHFETDLEIPSGLAFASFKAKLLEILKIMDGKFLADGRIIGFVLKTSILAAAIH